MHDIKLKDQSIAVLVEKEVGETNVFVMTNASKNEIISHLNLIIQVANRVLAEIARTDKIPEVVETIH